MDRVAQGSEPLFLPLSRTEDDRRLDRLYSVLAEVARGESGGIVTREEREILESVIYRLVLVDTLGFIIGEGYVFFAGNPGKVSSGSN